jgi:hypothetical protein
MHGRHLSGFSFDWIVPSDDVQRLSYRALIEYDLSCSLSAELVDRGGRHCGTEVYPYQSTMWTCGDLLWFHIGLIVNYETILTSPSTFMLRPESPP